MFKSITTLAIVTAPAIILMAVLSTNVIKTSKVERKPAIETKEYHFNKSLLAMAAK